LEKTELRPDQISKLINEIVQKWRLRLAEVLVINDSQINYLSIFKQLQSIRMI